MTHLLQVCFNNNISFNSLQCFVLDQIRQMFKTVKYSEQGSNARKAEEEVYKYFIDYLDDCEKGKHSCLHK